jgi:cysteine desulfurase
MKDYIFFDHAATTPVVPEVREAMLPFLGAEFGNPATLYSVGNRAAEAVDQARASVADLLGASTDEIYFTSGGTESDNWALKGVGCVTCGGREQCGYTPPHIITSKAEHHAVLDPCEFLESIGVEVTVVDVDKYGCVNPDDIRNALRENTKLVSIMHANNEVGSINDVRKIAEITRGAGALFHTDAVQTVGKLNFTVDDLGCDLLSLSAHKFHGPKGIGALYARKGTRLGAFMHGGAQEKGKRAGTSNVPGIVGLGAAARMGMEQRDEQAAREQSLSQKVIAGVKHLPGIEVLGHPDLRLPGIVTMLVEGVEGEAIVLSLDAQGIAAASGSACTTGSLDPSHVLLAMGFPPERAHGSLRVSFGRASTGGQVDYFLEVFEKVIGKLREMSPTWKG